MITLHIKVHNSIIMQLWVLLGSDLRFSLRKVVEIYAARSLLLDSSIGADVGSFISYFIG